jgi:hypothetical protein
MELFPIIRLHGQENRWDAISIQDFCAEIVETSFVC